jgi:hypothetical protein
MNDTRPPLQIAVLPGGDGGSLHDGIGPERARRGRLPLAVGAGAALVGLAFWLFTAPTELRRLPSQERAALAERTLANLRDICRGNDRPRDFCRDQANLLLDLPECGQACRTEARDELLADTAVK